MDQSIITFLEKQTVATICCMDEDQLPYCFNSFYSFDKKNNCLYFKSSVSTHHGKLLQIQENVAGTVVMDQLDKILVKGIQFTGRVVKNDLFNVAATMHYHTLHPMALAVPGEMWTLHFDSIKFTDNAQGFGTKVIWKRGEEV